MSAVLPLNRPDRRPASPPATPPATPPAVSSRRPAGTGMRVEVLHDLDALRALLPQWEELAANAVDSNPFYEHWMLIPALEAYGIEGFRCVAVWEDGKLGLLMPMAVEQRFRGLPLQALRSWRHRNMLVSSPLLRAKSASRCVAALLQSDVAPVLHFDWLPTESAFYGALTEAAATMAMPWAVSDCYVRPILVKDRDPRARFNSNMKNNLRRCEAKLRPHGSITPVRLARQEDVAGWTQAFMQLEASGWKGKEGTALICREDDRRFVTEVFPEAFRRGQMQITGLDLGGRPLARHIMFIAGEGAYCFKIAYDDAHASASPGLLGEVDNVRQFAEIPGVRWLDSNTARENVQSYARVWKDCRTLHRVAIGLSGMGRLAVSALPVVRLLRQALSRVVRRQHAERGST